MQLIIWLFLFSSFSLYGADYGTGSDGACSFGTGVQAKADWNCTTVTVTGNATFPGASVVIIRATSTVTIQAAGVLNVAGTTLTAGPGGSNGGDCNVASCNNINGQGSGAGNGGGLGADNGDFAGAGGGGGAGGSYNSSYLGTNGVVGQNAGGATAGGSLGTIGSGYGSESNFILTALTGGSGGGAGGSGEDSSTTPAPGGDGGGGGGAIIIIAASDITIEGQINANGGAGQNGTNNAADGTGGGGGGGSGGAVYIYSSASVTINGSVTATGGTAGAGGSGAGATAAFGGSGGAGGKGRIRIDSYSGSFSGSGTVNPSPLQVPLMNKEVFTSDIQFGCAYKEITTERPTSIPVGLTFMFVFMLLITLPKLWRKN